MIPSWFAFLNFFVCGITLWILAIKKGNLLYKKALENGQTTSSKHGYLMFERQQSFYLFNFLEGRPRTQRRLIISWAIVSVLIFFGHNSINNFIEKTF